MDSAKVSSCVMSCRLSTRVLDVCFVKECKEWKVSLASSAKSRALDARGVGGVGRGRL